MCIFTKPRNVALPCLSGSLLGNALLRLFVCAVVAINSIIVVIVVAVSDIQPIGSQQESTINNFSFIRRPIPLVLWCAEQGKYNGNRKL